MIPKECKRLAEVDFPIAEVSRHSAREKSIRHGHPSTLHLWWARRPLAACRSMLMALLLPDPCDDNCPEEFKEQAAHILTENPPIPWRAPDGTDLGLRKSLLSFIADFANWDNSSNPVHLNAARQLVKAAHGDEPPLLVDPFAGGGSIPLEGLRVGCDVFASDLNPVACLILKVMLEDIPRHGPKLAEELRRVGPEIKQQAEKVLAEFYPKDQHGAVPIAYLWARTVRCESPNCGAEIPLVRSCWLSKRSSNAAAFRFSISPKSGNSIVELINLTREKKQKVDSGTTSLGKAKCLACGAILSAPRVKAQIREQFGGANPIFDGNGLRIGGALLVAVVEKDPQSGDKQFRLPTERDYSAVRKTLVASKDLRKVLANEPLPGPERTESATIRGNYSFMPINLYGPRGWGDLFTARQQQALSCLAQIIHRHELKPHGRILACVLSRCADYWSANALWAQEGGFVAHTFGRQALPMVWDFAEVFPFSGSTGSFQSALDWVIRVVESSALTLLVGQVQVANATECPLPDNSASIWFTDPPYYDAIPYANLSDFFLVWLKRALPASAFLRDPYDAQNPLSPKSQEIIDDFDLFRGAPKEKARELGFVLKDRTYFENSMAVCFQEGQRVLKAAGLGCVVFAHKTTEGWEALLNGLIKGGWTITSSWPIATERPGRLRSQESSALATSVHLVCRPRPENAPVGDWAEVRRELPKRVGDWMERLQGEGIRGADLVFACIGPALQIYSQYSKVVDPSERQIPLGGDPAATEPHKRGYLAYVWETVGRLALQQVLGTAEARARNSAAGALEEDARLTALFLWTIQSTNETNGSRGGRDTADIPDSDDDDEEAETTRGKSKGYNLIFDVVRRFAQPLGIDLPKWENRIIETKKGVVTLLSVRERAKQLFGEDGARGVADDLERDPFAASQLEFFLGPVEAAVPKVRGRRTKGATKAGTDTELHNQPDATTLDRVHAAMLLQASGRANALRALLKAEKDRGPDFLRLANALSALYPKGSEEKRLLDAMLLAVPR